MKKIDLTKGSVVSVLLALALPIMGSSFLQFTYNLVDMLWVGKLGSNAVASVGSSSFYIGLGHSINALVVIGAGIKVSHALGQNEESEVKGYINAGMALALMISLVYGMSILLGGKYLIGFLGIQNIEVEKNACLYLAWSAPMLFFAFFNTLFTRVLGSFGNTKSALKISGVGIIINIVLDPLLIYGLKMGVAGAAIATLIANMIMFVLFLGVGKAIFRFDFKLGVASKKLKEITQLGLPMAFQRVLFTVVNIMLAKIIATFGSDAIAAQKIGLQIESITYMITGGLNGAVASFTGQNFGAKKYDRIRNGYKTALGIGVTYAIVTAMLFSVFSEELARLFVKDTETILIASNYLQIIAYSQIFNAMEMVSNGLFTGLGMPKIPASISIIFTVLRIPMALLLITSLGINGIWWSITLSTLLKGMTLYFIYAVKVRKKYS